MQAIFISFHNIKVVFLSSTSYKYHKNKIQRQIKQKISIVLLYFVPPLVELNETTKRDGGGLDIPKALHSFYRGVFRGGGGQKRAFLCDVSPEVVKKRMIKRVKSGGKSEKLAKM